MSVTYISPTEKRNNTRKDSIRTATTVVPQGKMHKRGSPGAKALAEEIIALTLGRKDLGATRDVDIAKDISKLVKCRVRPQVIGQVRKKAGIASEYAANRTRIAVAEREISILFRSVGWAG